MTFHRILIFVAFMSQSETPGAGATEGFREAKELHRRRVWSGVP